MADLADSERYMNMGPPVVHRGLDRKYRPSRRPIQRGCQNQWVLVGVAGPKRKIQERLAGFPDLTTTIVDMFSAHDKIVTRLVWRGTYTGSYGGCQACGQAGRGP